MARSIGGSSCPIRHTAITMRLLLLVLLCSGAWPRPSAEKDQQQPELMESIEVGGFLSESDFNECYSNLNASDANQNGEVNAAEYVTFAQLMAPNGTLSDVQTFAELPLVFQAAFFGTACLCQDEALGGGGDPECCKGDNANIRVPSMPPEEMDMQDRLYMYAVCSYTNAAVDSGLTAAPSAPTAPSSPAPAPAAAPSPPSTISLPAAVEYQIAVANGQADLTPADVATYLDDLIRAMDVLAPEVAAETFGSSSGASGRRALRQNRQRQKGQQELRRRRLSVAAAKPSEAKILSNVTCPSGTPSTSLCQNIEATVLLVFVDEEDPLEKVAEYQGNLSEAIAEGRLGASLEQVNPQSRATVLTPTSETASGLSGGAIAGICVAAVVVVGLAGYGYHRSHQTQAGKTPAERKASLVPVDTDVKPSSTGPTAPAASVDHAGDASIASEDVYTLPEPTLTPAVAATAAAAAAGPAADKMLGASEPDYGRASRKAVEAMEAGEDIVAEPELDVHPDSSSNAGSSGWSSSAGISSLNTGSIDDSMDQAAALGATLASIGATSALAQKSKDRSKSALDEPSTGEEPSRSQLDALIEAGDWAAVGATAALLAAASDSQSEQSKSEASGDRSAPREGGTRSLDALRAAELDNLVDAGDWEGVVLAAAKFEAAESSAGSRSSIENESLDTGTPGTGSAATPSVETSVSESASKVQRRAEIRAEVEALVRRVVPEEIDNVDEMMNQFKGREEELVETLRTMQERSVAQKARAAGQKAAKSEARRSVQRGVVPGVDPSAAEASSEGSNVAGSDAMGGRRALEAAIEAGDWDAVGQAAALMTDSSVASGSTGDIDRLVDAMSAASSSAAGSSGGGLRRRLQLEGVDEDRARELDDMIERGDWTGVVEATKKFKEADAKKPARSAEEEEALREAENWARIAEESRAAAGAADAGASDAAEWAIQRSLEQLNKKEEEMQKGKESEDDDEEEV